MGLHHFQADVCVNARLVVLVLNLLDDYRLAIALSPLKGRARGLEPQRSSVHCSDVGLIESPNDVECLPAHITVDRSVRPIFALLLLQIVLSRSEQATGRSTVTLGGVSPFLISRLCGLGDGLNTST